MNSLEEWLIKDDEKAYLSQKSLWNYDGEEVEDELLQLGPHASVYTNELKPIFLFEVKNDHQLKLFNSVMVRDGAVSLLCFFYRWPSPPLGHAKLLIEESLSYLVPRAWEELVCYYSYDVDEYQGETFDELFLSGLIHPDVICLDTIEQRLKNLKKSVELKNINAYVMTQSFSPRDKEHFENTPAYYVELIGLLKSYLPKLQSISWKEISTQDVRGIKVFNLDERKVVCSDSYVDFNLFSRGAHKLFGPKVCEEKFATLELSPFHRIHLMEKRTEKNQALSQKIYSTLELIRSEIDQDFVKTQSLSDRSHLVLGCPQELSSFLFSFLRNEENVI